VELQNKVNELLTQQLSQWDLAARNYEGLKKVLKHTFIWESDITIGVQFNPERIVSSSAKVDKASIEQRKCFLCHLPPQQESVAFGDEYLILVNPFPIFSRHLTIPHISHTDQRIKGKMADMLLLARELDEFTVFYNGPRCGASAPDHFHFQAGNKGFMNIEREIHKLHKITVKTENGTTASYLYDYLRPVLILEGDNEDTLCRWFDQVYQILEKIAPQDEEPMMNVLANYQSQRWSICVFPRKLHRPWQYFAEGTDHFLISPGAVDMGGVFIVPRQEDFNKITPEVIESILEQVGIGEKEFQTLIQEFSRAGI
jgi:ATP adenylyltransferase/5',5'''-P-1,P-4-tetraphosphate phosphorylase II